MKVCVVVPPIKDFYYTPHRGSFIGAHIVQQILKSYNLNADLFIFPNLKKKAKRIPIPEELSYLKDFIHQDEHGPVSFFTSYKLFGPELKECAYLIVTNNYKKVYISCFAFCYAQETIDLAYEIKKLDPSIKIVAGGGGVSVFPQAFKETKFFNELFTEEAETSIPLSLGGKPLNSVIPAVVKTITTKKHTYYSTYLTRGCPKGCKFCSVPLVHGRRLKVTDKEVLLNLICKLPEENIFLNFEDDNVLIVNDLFIKVLKGIKFKRKKVLFSCENGIDYYLLNIDLLKELVKLGFRQFNFSLVSVDSAISKNQNRKNDLEKLKEFLKFLHHCKIPSITYFIAGFKGESRTISLKNLLFLARTPTRIGFSPFYPVPGIEGFEEKEIFKKFNFRITCGSSLWPWNRSLSTEEMVTLFRLVRLINLWKKETKTQEEIDLLKRCQKEKKLYTFLRNEPSPREVKKYDKEMVKLFFEEFSF